MKVLSFNPALCEGAGVCQITCAKAWFKVEDVAHSSIRVTAVDGHFQARFCIQCGKCLEVCPVDALYQDKQGIVRVRKNQCVGCMSCVGFCPYGVMYIVPTETTPFKCIACGQCVSACPHQALALVEVDQPDTRLWQAS